MSTLPIYAAEARHRLSFSWSHFVTVLAHLLL